MKVGDFGIAKRVANDSTALRTETGTPYFSAPETIPDDYGEHSKYTNAVDIWSLGCVIYNVLAQRPPFESRSSKLMPFPIRPLSARTSVQGVAFLEGLLRLDPKSRWTAQEALEHQWIQAQHVTITMLDRSVDQEVSLTGPQTDHTQHEVTLKSSLQMPQIQPPTRLDCSQSILKDDSLRPDNHRILQDYRHQLNELAFESVESNLDALVSRREQILVLQRSLSKLELSTDVRLQARKGALLSGISNELTRLAQAIEELVHAHPSDQARSVTAVATVEATLPGSNHHPSHGQATALDEPENNQCQPKKDGDFGNVAQSAPPKAMKWKIPRRGSISKLTSNLSKMLRSPDVDFFDHYRKGDLLGAQRLVERGTDIEKRDRYGCTALHYAATNGYVFSSQILPDW